MIVNYCDPDQGKALTEDESETEQHVNVYSSFY